MLMEELHTIQPIYELTMITYKVIHSLTVQQSVYSYAGRDLYIQTVNRYATSNFSRM